nr:hypothetical protein [Bacteroides sp. 51]
MMVHICHPAIVTTVNAANPIDTEANTKHTKPSIVPVTNWTIKERIQPSGEFWSGISTLKTALQVLKKISEYQMAPTANAATTENANQTQSIWEITIEK